MTPEEIATEFGGSPHWEQELVFAVRAYGERCAANAEARAEAWRKAAGDMLESEMARADKERFRALLKKTEALTRDAAASGRRSRPTADDLALRIGASGGNTTKRAEGAPSESEITSLRRALAEAEKALAEAKEYGEAVRLRSVDYAQQLKESRSFARAAEERAAQAERALRSARELLNPDNLNESFTELACDVLDEALQEAAPKGRAPEAPPDPKSEIP